MEKVIYSSWNIDINIDLDMSSYTKRNSEKVNQSLQISLG